MNGSKPPRWNFRQAVRYFLSRLPSPPSKITFVAVAGLYLTFFGVRSLCRFFKRFRAVFFTPNKVAIVAIAGLLGMFIIWLLFDVPTARETFWQRQTRFANEMSFILYVYALVVPILIWLTDKLSSVSEDEKIRRTQKERIKLLDGFAPSPENVSLFGNRSIYDAIISTLSRLEDKKGKKIKDGKIRFQVCLLLCSPALDYPGNPQTIWGEDFKKQIVDAGGHDNIRVDICYLPIEPMLGFNPMEDFLSVLANFISEEPGDFESKHQMLVNRTNTIAGEIKNLADQYLERVKIHRPMFNVPFQIVLVLGDNFTEVVVSFAGREILESGKIEPKGFFSSDPYVVETFHQIYKHYVVQESRLPFVPKHTRGVIEEHSQQPAHQITDYLGVIPNLEVGEGCFSPALANSPKFTSWVITKVLTKDDTSVLDIGSGTGVLALMAQKTLQQQFGVFTSRIVAVESDDRSFQTLQKNCPAGSGIEVKKWYLSPKVENDKQVGGCFCDIGDGNKEVENGCVGQFRVIIADLPFVDVKESLPKDQRFFDPDHKAHRTLFMAVRKNNWLADNGRLITAFSSLGGPDDVLRFECLIAENDLQIVQRVDFHESNYLWIVHVIVRKEDFDRDKYWWEKFKARQLVNANKKGT